MKTKSKLWLSITTFVLCLGVMITGVYSALSVNLNINGTLGFNMHNAMITVSGTVYNLADTIEGQDYVDKVDREIQQTLMGVENKATVNLNFGDMYFCQKDTSSAYDIIFELAFTNISSTAIQLSISAPTVSDGITLLHNDTTNGYTDFSTNYSPVIAQNTSVTVKFALRLENMNFLLSKVGYSWNNIMFEEAEISPHTDAQGVVYTLNADGNAWNVTGHASNYQESIEIPSTIYNMPVTAISDKAFYMCTSLTDIQMPNSIETIGAEAFSNCTNLDGVTIPNSVESIGNYAFGYCNSLISVTIPENVTSIGDCAFGSCINLIDVSFVQENSSKINVGTTIFSGCNSLNGVYTSNSNAVTSYKTVTNLDPYYGLIKVCPSSYTDSLGLKYTLNTNEWSVTGHADTYSAEIIIPSILLCYPVTNITDSIFIDCESLTNLTIGDNVKSIGPHAFRNCINLTSVTIGAGVTSIGASSFRGCTKLTSLNVPDMVEEYILLLIVQD